MKDAEQGIELKQTIVNSVLGTMPQRLTERDIVLLRSNARLRDAYNKIHGTAFKPGAIG